MKIVGFGFKKISAKSQDLEYSKLLHLDRCWESRLVFKIARMKIHQTFLASKYVLSNILELLKINLSYFELLLSNDLPSIASTHECTHAKHVFTWRQTSEFQVSNFEVSPPKCEVLLLDTAQGEGFSNQQGRKKVSARHPTFNHLQNQVKELAEDYSFWEVVN